MTKKANQRRSRYFSVPKAMLGNFFSYIDDKELEFQLIEIEEEDGLNVEVAYDESEREDIMSLIEIIDDHEKDLEGTDENDE